MAKQLPQWASLPFTDFMDHQHTVRALLELSIRGISLLRSVPELIEGFGPYGGETSESHGDRLEYAKQQAEFAQREVDSGFPLLHAQTTVSLWTSLESLVRGFLANWLANEPGAMNLEAVRRIKISFAEYQALAPDQRCYHIVDLLERDVQASLKQGVSRFEASLGVFDLSGPVDDDIKKDLFELCNVRNVLVHRRGVADSRLVGACPWLGLRPGDPVVIKHDAVDRYMDSTISYVVTLIKRVRVRLGVDAEAEEKA